jgi:ribosomal small subunit protein bTHX
MGKGDQRTKKGKRNRGSYGVTRRKKPKKAHARRGGRRPS